MSDHKIEIDVTLNTEGVSRDFDALEQTARSGVRSVVQAVGQMTEAISETGTEARRAGQDYGRASDEMRQAATQASGETDELRDAVQDAQGSTEDFGNAVDELAEESENAGSAQQVLGEQTEQTRQVVEKSGGTFEVWGKLAKTAITGVVAAAGTFYAAMAAGAGLSVKFGTEYQQASNAIQAATGATEEEMEGLKEVMGSVYANNFGEDMNDVADAVTNVKKSLGGTDEEIQKATEAAFAFRDTFGYEVPESTRAASAIMKNFGGDAQHAYDLMAKGAQKGLDFSGELLDSIDEYSVQFAKSGLTAEQMFNILASGTEAGAWNLDKIGDAVKELNVRLVDGSDTTKEGLKAVGLNADEVAKKMSQGGETATEAYKQVVKGLAEMDDKQAQNIAGVNLFGTMWEDLGPDVVAQLAEMEGAYDDVSGTMDKINEVKYDDAASALEALKRKAEVSILQPISENIMPAISDATEAAVGYIDRLANAYESEGVNGLVQEAANIFVDIADAAAEQAPRMIEIAAGYIEQMVEGFSKNKGRLIKAGVELVKSLAGAAVKLLPSELQKPVKEAVEDIIDSITGGGIKSGLDTFGRLFQKGFKAVTTVTKTILPPFVKAVDKVAENLDILIPLVVAGVTAFKGYSVVVELLTVKTTLATAAHTAWNAAMNANPIGLVITGVLALGSAMAAYTLLAEDEVTTQDKINKSLEKSSQNLDTVSESAVRFLDGIGDAGSIFDDFNNSIIVSNEVQQEVAGKMDQVQSEITQIARTATEERRSLTGEEVQRLQDLLSQMEQLTEQELNIQKSYAQAVKDSAQTLAATYDGSAEDYAEASQKIINSATETKNSVINKAYEQMVETNAINREMVGNVEGCTEEWYEAESVAAQERYQAAVESAKTEYGDTLAIIEQGYTDRATAGRQYLSTMGRSHTQLENEKARHDQVLKDLESKYSEDFNGTLGERYESTNNYYEKREEEDKRHQETTASILEKMSGDLSEAQLEEAGIMLAMVAQTAASGAELDDETKTLVGNFLKSLSNMPEETKETFENTVKGAMEGLEGFDEIQDVANKEGISFLEALAKTLEVQSPSQAVKRIFAQVSPGATEGLDEGKERLLTKGQTLVSDFLETLNGETLQNGGTQAGTTVVSGMISGMLSKVGDIANAGAQNSRAASTALGSVKNNKVGSDFSSTFESGILSKKKNVTATALGIATAARAAAVTVTMTATGATFGSQYISGIRSKNSDSRSAGDMLASVAKAACGAVSAMIPGTQFGSQYTSGINSKNRSSRSAGEEIGTNAKSGAGSVSAYGTGQDFGTGFCNGIDSMIGSVVRAASNFAAIALNAAKETIDSNSPSKETDKLGGYFGEGFVNGILRMTGKAIEAAGKMGRKSVEAFRENLNPGNIDLGEAVQKAYDAVSYKNFEIRSDTLLHVAYERSKLPDQENSNMKTGSIDTTVNQIVNINQPVKSPIEMSRELKRAGKELAFG